MLECWSVGVLECWSVGVLECWSVALLAELDPGGGLGALNGRKISVVIGEEPESELLCSCPEGAVGLSLGFFNPRYAYKNNPAPQGRQTGCDGGASKNENEWQPIP